MHTISSDSSLAKTPENQPRILGDVHDVIRNFIQSHDIVVFMKGTASHPLCGFSKKALMLLEKNLTGSLAAFKPTVVDVLSAGDQWPNLRDDIKVYSDWPTFPQIYIRGEFIGGSDVLSALDQSDDLADYLKKLLNVAKEIG